MKRATLYMLMIAGTCLGGPNRVMAGDTYWQKPPADPGNWNTGANWSSDWEPLPGDIAYICNGGTCEVTLAGEVCYELYLGRNLGESGTLNIYSGSLAVETDQWIGFHGDGTVNQYGGTNTVGTDGSWYDYLYLATYENTEGKYVLWDGTLIADREYIGLSGDGEFVQNGGLNKVHKILWIGYDTGSSGMYIMTGGSDGGTLDVRNGTIILGSGDSPGTLVLDGGVAIANELVHPTGATFSQGGHSIFRVNTITDYAGTLADFDGTLEIGHSGGDGSGSFSRSIDFDVNNDFVVGYNAPGSFTQSGGNTEVGLVGAYGLYVGKHTGAIGTYSLNGGSLSNQNKALVGYSGTGTFNQSTGSHWIGGPLYLGYNSGSNGTYNLSDGNLTSSTNQYIGWEGTGTFVQTGGSNSVGVNLSIGRSSTSTGMYDQRGGATSVPGFMALGWYEGSTGTCKLSGGTLDVEGDVVNGGGYGTLIVDGGALSVGGPINVDEFHVGHDPDANSAYTLDGDRQLSVNVNEYIGNAGTGEFTQHSGTHSVANDLCLGYLEGSCGTYRMNGGKLTVANEILVGVDLGEDLLSGVPAMVVLRHRTSP